MTNIKPSSKSHILHLAAWLPSAIPWFLLAVNTSHTFEALIKPKSKSHHTILLFASCHRQQNPFSFSPVSSLQSWSFPRTWFYRLHTEYCIKKKQKQKTCIRDNSGHCWKIPGTALLFCSLILWFPPTPHTAPFILKSNAFCHLLVFFHSQLPPLSLAPGLLFLIQMMQLYLPSENHRMFKRKAPVPSPIPNPSFLTEDSGVQRDEGNGPKSPKWFGAVLKVLPVFASSNPQPF